MNQASDFSTVSSCIPSIMHFFFFLIAVISTTAIAKPLPDAQTNTPFGYFPSDFGAAGQFLNPIKSWAKNPPFSPIPLIHPFFQQSSIRQVSLGEALHYSGLTVTILYKWILPTQTALTLAIRPLFRMGLPKGIPPAPIQQRSIRRELVQHSNNSENSGVALTRAVIKACAALETNMERLGPLQAN